MSNEYYTPSGSPSTASSGSSSAIRSEFDRIAAGFAKLPILSGNGNKAVVVNSGGDALTVTGGTLLLAGNLTTTGAFATTFSTTGSVTHTLPLVSGTLMTRAGTQTLTNKTLASPGFNASVAGSLTNLALTTPVLSGSVVGTYTINGSGGAIASPIFASAILGGFTFGGTPTFTSPGLYDSTVSGAITLSSGQLNFTGAYDPGDGNQLGYYAEGTFTPTLDFYGETTGLTVAYSTQLGTYTRIGSLQIVTVHIATSTFTHTSGTFAALVVNNLPFNYKYNDASSLERCTAQVAGFNITGGLHSIAAARFGGGFKSVALHYKPDSVNGYTGYTVADHTSGNNVTVRFTLISRCI